MVQDGSKNIQNIRTFALDAALARTKNQKRIVEIPKKPLPEEPHTEAKTVVSPQESRETEVSVIPAAPVRKEKPVPHIPQNIPQKPTTYEMASPSLSTSVKRLGVSEELQAIEPEKESLLSEEDDPFEVNPHRSGSIIRDTKRKRFKLFPAMVEAFSQWFEKQKQTYNALLHPHHAVPKAEMRKDVIEEAVKHGEQAPKEDFEAVAKRMKGKERIAPTSTLTFKKKEEVAEPTWTYVEEKTAELTGGTVENQASQQIDDNSAVTASPKSTQTSIEVPMGTEEKATQETLTVTETSPDTEQERAYVEEVTTEPEPERLPPLNEEPELTIPEPSEPQTARLYAATVVPRRFGLALFLVIVSASLLGSGASYYFFVLKDAPQTVAEVFKIPSLIAIQNQQPLALQERSTLLAEIERQIQNTQDAVQIYLTTQTENGDRPASATEILGQLAFQAPGSFTRSVRELVFGASAQKEPFIVLSVTTFDTAFAGMLAWEKTMSGDLVPLFGEPVVESFDPSARTATQVREAFFKDTISSNKNVRLLLDEKGDDRIIYTFVNQNTILITTTREALEELLPLVQ